MEGCDIDDNNEGGAADTVFENALNLGDEQDFLYTLDALVDEIVLFYIHCRQFVLPVCFSAFLGVLLWAGKSTEKEMISGAT